jgi:hypothetical protein
MDKPQRGLLQDLPYSQRAWIDLELDDSFADLDDALDELRACLHNHRRLLERTLHGVSK